MSDYLYFACGWVIRPNADYDRLRTLADQIGIELVVINPIYSSQDGYMVQTFAVQTRDEAELVAFIQTAGVELGLTHWYGVPKAYYERGTRFDLALVLPYFRDQWLAGMKVYGEHNEQLRQTRDSQPPGSVV
ncbi:MAG: hypothetical protein MUF87_17970 [Anaerolineae bacterium]|nr:hypothetical protein [Anaerolineae bacterium]